MNQVTPASVTSLEVRLKRAELIVSMGAINRAYCSARGAKSAAYAVEKKVEHDLRTGKETIFGTRTVYDNGHKRCIG
jgi:hypothetical protein